MTGGAGDRVHAAHVAATIRLADLAGELEAVGESTAASPDDEHDAEGSTVGYERARVGALVDEARRAVHALDSALRRLADGSYGTCTGCGQAITHDRLDALPSTTACRTCSAARPRAHRLGRTTANGHQADGP